MVQKKTDERKAINLRQPSTESDQAQWRFARTYVETYPHEYTLKESMDADAFSRAIRCIEQWGVVEPFWSSRRKYLYVDDRKYWHMGDPASENREMWPGLINRTWLDVGRYRDNARLLGYDDSAVERMAARWVQMLERARRRAD